MTHEQALAKLIVAERRATDARSEVTLAAERCRDLGVTWEQIGAAVGITRPAAHYRYALSARRHSR